MRVLGISGIKRSGKDTLADLIQSRLINLDVGHWDRIAFADPIKKLLSGIFGVSLGWIEEWKVKEEIPEGWEMNVRGALINIGDRFREIKESVWVDRALRSDGNILITDVRYPNELEAVRKRGPVVRICRPGIPVLNNPSENSLISYDDICLSRELEGVIRDPKIPYDFFLINDGTLSNLEQKLDLLIMPGLEKLLKFF